MKYSHIVCLVWACMSPIAPALDIQSPNGKIILSFEVTDMGMRAACPVYRVAYRGNPVIADSQLGFELDNGVWLGQDVRVLSTQTTHHDTTWKPVYGERSTVRD